MLRQRQEAVTTVQFALIVPLFLFIVFGTLEMGRVLSAWMVLTSEAREAARYAAVTYDSTASSTAELTAQTSAVRTFVHQRLNGVLASSGIYQEPDVRYVPTGANQSPLVQVTLYYQVPLIVPLISHVLPNPFPLAARSAMRGE